MKKHFVFVVAFQISSTLNGTLRTGPADIFPPFGSQLMALQLSELGTVKLTPRSLIL